MSTHSSPRTVPQALGRLRVALDAAYLEASRELDLTAQQAELLCAARRPSAVGALATQLRCDRSNVSRLVDRAAARGLVQRRAGEADARVSLIELTPAGEALARRFIATLEARLAPLLADWPEQRRRAAVATLTTLAEALETPGTPPPPRRAARSS